MAKRLTKIQGRQRRHKRIRREVAGTAKRPRLSVYRSNRFIYAQLIDDERGVTLAATTDQSKKPAAPAGQKSKKTAPAKVAAAYTVGQDLAARAGALGITAAVFDRGGYLYRGRIRSLAEGARAGGLTF